jgi:hypothetical protein
VDNVQENSDPGETSVDVNVADDEAVAVVVVAVDVAVDVWLMVLEFDDVAVEEAVLVAVGASTAIVAFVEVAVWVPIAVPVKVSADPAESDVGGAAALPGPPEAPPLQPVNRNMLNASKVLLAPIPEVTQG